MHQTTNARTRLNTSTNRFDGQGAFPHVLVVLCVVFAFCLPGLVGHQPWKPDEGYIFAGIFHTLPSGDWIVPHLAGEPFMEKPPLCNASVTLDDATEGLPWDEPNDLCKQRFADVHALPQVAYTRKHRKCSI